MNLSFTRMDPSMASSLPPGQACTWWAQQSPSHPPSRSTGPLGLGTGLALDTQDTPLRPIPTCLHPGWAVAQTSLTFTSKGAVPPHVSHRLAARPLTPPEGGRGQARPPAQAGYSLGTEGWRGNLPPCPPEGAQPLGAGRERNRSQAALTSAAVHRGTAPSGAEKTPTRPQGPSSAKPGLPPQWACCSMARSVP